MPPLLLPKIARALSESKAEVILVDNLTDEPSPIANCSLSNKVNWCHQVLGLTIIDKILCNADSHFEEDNIFYYPLRSSHHIGLHDKQALADALSFMVSQKQGLQEA